MALKYLSLIICLLFFLWGAECPAGYVNIDDVCYYKTHLDVLQDFIDANQSLRGMKPYEIGFQEWTKNRLTYLYLGNNEALIYWQDNRWGESKIYGTLLTTSFDGTSENYFSKDWTIIYYNSTVIYWFKSYIEKNSF